jgi:hypothetical protein
MDNSSLSMIFLLLALAGLVFGIGVVTISRRKARAVPQIQRAAPVEVVSQVPSPINYNYSYNYIIIIIIIIN